MAYRQNPGRGNLQKFANVSQLCPGGGGGDECKAFTGRKTKKVKDTREREKRKKGGPTVEGQVEKTFDITPGTEVAHSQVDSGTGKETGWRHSNGKSPSEFKEEVQQTNIFESDKDISGDITPANKEQTSQIKTMTRRNKKGKAKMKVKTTSSKPGGRTEALTVRKDRLIGKDKFKSYTTNPEHANEQNKLVSQQKMKRKQDRANKQLYKRVKKPTTFAPTQTYEPYQPGA